MAEASSLINLATVAGGSNIATYQDGSSRMHQEVVVQTQTGAADPVSVNTTNPMPVQGNIASGNADSGNPVSVAGVFNSSPPTFSNGQRAAVQVDANGFLKVNIAAGAAAGGTSSTFGAAVPAVGTAVGFSDGTNMQLGRVDGSGNLKVNVAAGGVPAGQDNTSFTSGVTNGLPAIAVADNTNSVGAISQGNQGVLKMSLGRQLYVAPQANVIGGWSPSVVITTASTNLGTLKSSAGSSGVIVPINTSGTIGFLKLFNKASNPVLGTDTPVQCYPVPANTSGAGLIITIPAGLSFNTGIAYAVTGAIALNDTSNGPAGIALNFGSI